MKIEENLGIHVYMEYSDFGKLELSERLKSLNERSYSFLVFEMNAFLVYFFEFLL